MPMFCYYVTKNCLQRTLKLQDQAVINHEMPELGILVRTIVWPVNVRLNVNTFPYNVSFSI